MNSTFNSALRLSTSIRKDLAALSDPSSSTDASTQQEQQQPPSTAALGTISASLTAFSRTLDEYAALARQELDPTKQEKAQGRLAGFHSELTEYRARLDALKAAREDAAHAQTRAELLGRRPYAAATPENPYAGSAAPTTATASGSAGYGSGGYGHSRGVSGSGAGASFAGGAGGDQQVLREEHALREQSFFSSANATLDQYISQGQAVLNDLEVQRGMLKNVQKSLYSAANTLGLSGNTIRMVERRAREDKWIFWAGVIIFIGFCWLCLHFLR